MTKKGLKKIAVELSAVTKKYILHHQKPTFSEHFLQGFRNVNFLALKSINLQINKGEKIGIIGKNGSGKTTLLKLIAGITAPTSGKIKTYGKVVSLIDLESGFHPDLSGEENIYLNGLLIGMSKEEISKKIKSITEFAAIGKFINEPLFTYSQGMKLRLGFSVAIHADPDILILDEGISVGDQNFQEKSLKKIEEFFAAKKTIIIVTHQLDFLKNHANKIIWIDKGQIKELGGKKVILNYEKNR